MTEFFRNKNVLITGAGGFIGARLASELLSLGAKVRAFVRYTSRAENGLLKHLPSEQFNHIEIIRGDLRDFAAVNDAARDQNLVFHLGALISIPYSYVHPVETVETNILGTMNILQACRQYGCQLVHTSTSEVYGTALYTPIDEQHPLQAQSPYSASKIGADKLVESYYCAYGLPSVTVRPFNTYGPGQSTRAVIPTIITQALASNTIHLGSLETLRDFTYLDDTVRGFLLAASRGTFDGQTYNLGTGEQHTIGEITERIIRLIGVTKEIIIDQDRIRPAKSEVMQLLSDNSKARRDLGWTPQVSLDNGLLQTIDWINTHPDFYTSTSYGI